MGKCKFQSSKLKPMPNAKAQTEKHLCYLLFELYLNFEICHLKFCLGYPLTQANGLTIATFLASPAW
jgi:hypothetical protein